MQWLARGWVKDQENYDQDDAWKAQLIIKWIDSLSTPAMAPNSRPWKPLSEDTEGLNPNKKSH